MVAWLGPALMAGASLVGSLFGGKKTSNRINYKQMVADAEAAGFNPLTVLRNGGAAGYMQGGEPTTLSRVAGGIADATQTFLANFDPMADQKRENETRLIEAQLANLQADTALKGGQLGSELSRTEYYNSRPAAGGRAAPGYAAATGALPQSAGASQTPTVEKPTVTNPYPTAFGLEVNPGLPDASAWEERYGEPGDWLGGVLTFGGDILSMIGRAQNELKRRTDERRKPGPGKPYNKADKIYIPPSLHRSATYY